MLVPPFHPFHEVTPSYPVPARNGSAVLITGASTGIGLDAAGVLAEQGFRVYAGVRSEKAKEELKRRVPGADGKGMEGE